MTEDLRYSRIIGLNYFSSTIGENKMKQNTHIQNPEPEKKKKKRYHSEKVEV